MTDLRMRAICKALCRSGKFETGQGTCALICMGQLGDPRKKGCVHAISVHNDLAEQIVIALSPRLSWQEPSIEERPY